MHAARRARHWNRSAARAITLERWAMNEAFWVLTTVVFGIATGCLTQAWFTARAEVARLQRTSGSPDLFATLERIESTVEAMALEVERVAEYQRFATPLIAKQVSPVSPTV